MEPVEQVVEKRQNKLLNFFKGREKIIFLGILLLGIGIRLYYFFLTSDQPLWWDESDYMAYAKNLAGFNVDWTVTSQHNSLLPYIASIFFRLGLNEVTTKFFLVLIPSVILIYLTYKIATIMYNDKRIGLIASFLMAIFWNILFNSTRFHVDILALMFAFLGIYTFFKGYERREKIFRRIKCQWAIPLTVIFIILSYSVRRAYILFGVFFLIYMLSTRKIKSLFKDKYNWIAFAIVIILFLIVEKFIFISAIGGVASTYYHPDIALSLDAVKVFGTYFANQANFYSSTLLYLFWIGLILITTKLVFALGYFKRQGTRELRSDLFNFYCITITLLFFIFVLRINLEAGRGYEPRWLFPLLFGTFISISRGAIFLADYINNRKKFLGILLIVLLLGFGGYYQLQYANMTIGSKIDSFSGIRDASIYIQQISQPGDVIASVPIPQTAYYTERVVVNPNEVATRSGGENTIENFVVEVEKDSSIKYVLVTFTEPHHPPWMRNEGQEYARNPETGQVSLVRWEIPFMDSYIDFTKGEQQIKTEKTYGKIKFNLIDVKNDVFIYKITRE